MLHPDAFGELEHGAGERFALCADCVGGPERARPFDLVRQDVSRNNWGRTAQPGPLNDVHAVAANPDDEHALARGDLGALAQAAP